MPISAVPASDLVRHFGQWRDVALREPVYVQHRGRARLVLTSVELMTRLCASHGDGDAQAASHDPALLDSLAQPVVIVDAEGLIVVAGRAARHYFGERAVPGNRLTEALWPEAAPIVEAAVSRATGGGVEQSIELAEGARRIEIRIAPYGTGALLVGRDRAVEDARDRAQDRATAILAALGALPGHATARIGLRGYLVAPDASLVALTGFSQAALASARFTTLFDVASRVVVGDAIERAIDTGQVGRCAATLLANHAAPTPARIALAPERLGAAIVGVIALIAVDSSPEHG